MSEKSATRLNCANIVIVLVEPLSPGNIGAIARAMINMGFSDLRLVNPKADYRDEEARRLSRGALDVLEPIQISPNIHEAVADCTTLVATSHRPIRYKRQSYTAREIGAHLTPLCVHNKVAILFGRENRGLSNEEVKQCPWLLNIPTASEEPPLNISQAVMLVCYELFMTSFPTHANIPKLVSHKEMENFYSRVLHIINAAGFRHKNEDHTVFISILKRILSRIGLDDHELKVMFKLFNQFDHIVKMREQSDGKKL